MEELRTLNEIENDYEYVTHCDVDIVFKEIKQEAIKHIKELKCFNEDHTSEGMEEDRLNNIAKIDWIKHFFDIEEDELK